MTTKTDNKYLAIHLMLAYIAENKVLPIGGKQYRNLWQTKTVVRLSEQKQVLKSIGFGGTSCTFEQLSQSCVDEEDSQVSEDVAAANTDNNSHISYHDIISKATEAAYACKDDEHKSELFTLLCNFMNSSDKSKRDTSFLGSEVTRYSKGHDPRKRRRNDS